MDRSRLTTLVYYLFLGCIWLVLAAGSDSYLTFCRPLANCSHIDSLPVSHDARKLHTLYICEPDTLQTIFLNESSAEAFLQQAMRALDVRRDLCEAEHRALEGLMGGYGMGRKIFARRGGFPIYHAYDLLAASLASIHPLSHSHPHALPRNHSQSPRLFHNDPPSLYRPPAGLWLELGVASGTSLNLTAHLLERRNPSHSIPLHGFDSFLGLPTKWQGHMEKGAFSSQGRAPSMHPSVTLHQGWFNETLSPFLQSLEHCILLGVNIDNDLYEGALSSLLSLAPCLRPGSLLHFHEIYSTNDAHNPMEELQALFAFMQSRQVALRLMPVSSSFKEAAVFSVL